MPLAARFKKAGETGYADKIRKVLILQCPRCIAGWFGILPKA